jgi:hypothetical protein
MALRLQAAFGLRREESMKIRPGWADQGNALVLKDSWTKGGRERELPIRTEAQRAVLNEAKKLAAGGSLIPQGSTYKDQLKAFKAECQRVGINKVHGLRHRYAQTRYLEKTGWQCPARGGPTKKQLTPDQRSIDQRVRSRSRSSSGTAWAGHSHLLRSMRSRHEDPPPLHPLPRRADLPRHGPQPLQRRGPRFSHRDPDRHPGRCIRPT